MHLRSDLSYAAKSALYRVYQALNQTIKVARRAAGLPFWSLATAVNERTKFAQKMIDDYERAVAQEAKALGYDGAARAARGACVCPPTLATPFACVRE